MQSCSTFPDSFPDDSIHSVFSKQYASILISMFFRRSQLQTSVGSVLLKKKQTHTQKKTKKKHTIAKCEENLN